MVEN
ncbi:hypothetical protein D020_4633A, partial [Vibrio parahaemolyticus SBR10290]|jgi:hypothetical protein